MKEYQFQYTPMRGSLIAALLVIVISILNTFLVIHFKLNSLLMIGLSLGLIFLLFRALKEKVVHSCTAKLSETSVEFDFFNEIKVINFSDLISFKNYNGNNGPILYLKTQTYNFKIFANSNFCKTEDFKIFSDDTIIQIDKFKDKSNSTLIHEGSVYATKGFLYFLGISTFIYLLSFIVESKELRLYIGIGGGFYLVVMWMTYFNKRDLKSK